MPAPHPIRFVALESALADRLRAGAPDANGQPAERHVATGDGLPCRHCLAMIAKGEPFLIAAHRPFPAPQPYAEVGPIFLHAKACPSGGGSDRVPAFLDSPRYIVRGYGTDDRIVYGSGLIVETAAIPAAAADLLDDPRIAYLHVRSATNNCYHCRIERA
jgi:hypothetical protein